MNLHDVRTALAGEIREGLTLVASGYSITELAPTLDQLSGCFQAFAICQLLEAGDVASFRDNLARSAFARRFFLTKAREVQEVADKRLAVSRNESFFDALAAGHGALAQEIVASSIEEWRGDWEYEDDFYYFGFLHQLVRDPESRAGNEGLELLHRYEMAAVDLPPARGVVLKALAVSDEAMFGQGVLELLRERDRELQSRQAALTEADLATLIYWPRTFVSIEGLALIAIGRALGLRFATDLPLCPMVAQLPPRAPLVEDPFRGIQALLEEAAGG